MRSTVENKCVSLRRIAAGLALIAVGFAASVAPAAARDWQATEHTVYYAIDGDTGLQLYRSIGQNGPQVSMRRAIALTEYELLWGRDYTPDGNACRITRAEPFLTITYRLPRPRGSLAPPVAAKWAAFIEGMTIHEHIHGDLIGEMVDDIIAQTAGLVVQNDPNCQAIRAEVQARVIAAHERYKAKNRAFEADEMAPGGNVQQLVLGLVQ